MAVSLPHFFKAICSLGTAPAHGMWRCLRSRGLSSAAGVVFDIDGVLRRGGALVPGAPEALRLLSERSVPFIFMTNGGGDTEARKAQQLSDLLGLPVAQECMILSHSPFEALAPKLRGRRSLLVGGAETKRVARSYGFQVGTWAEPRRREYKT